MSDSSLIPVDCVALLEDQGNTGPIVILQDRTSNRLLPIWVGESEARAITMALNKIATPRPLTHSLLVAVIKKMEGRISRVIINRLERNTYYSLLCIDVKGKDIVIDARPSDALALALEVRVPILVTEEVMAAGGQQNPFPAQLLRKDIEDRYAKNPENEARLKAMLEKAWAREQKSSE